MGDKILIVDDDERLAAVVRDGLSHYGYEVSVVGDGVTALRTVRLRLPGEAHAAALLHGAPHFSTEAVQGGALRVYRVPAVRGGHTVGFVLVAASLHTVTSTTQTLLALLVGGALGLLLLVIVGSGMVVRRGLRPLGEMLTVAECTTARRLDQRITLHDPPVEVARLAATFNALTYTPPGDEVEVLLTKARPAALHATTRAAAHPVARHAQAVEPREAADTAGDANATAACVTDASGNQTGDCQNSQNQSGPRTAAERRAALTLPKSPVNRITITPGTRGGARHRGETPGHNRIPPAEHPTYHPCSTAPLQDRYASMRALDIDEKTFISISCWFELRFIC